MRILVTGPKGFVGARIMAVMPAIGAPSLRNAAEDDIRRLVDQAEPDVIIHTAAISDIAACARDPEASYRANVEIPIAITRTGVKTILFSTDQVYSGCVNEGPYSEDETKPANLYAVHKLEMERRILDINPDAVLLRGLEIVEGRDTICRLRYGKNWEELTAYQRKNFLNGPGKCCQALALDTSSDGLDLLGDDLYICRPVEGEAPPPFRIRAGKRIGIDYAEEAVDFPWRFTLEYTD